MPISFSLLSISLDLILDRETHTSEGGAFPFFIEKLLGTYSILLLRFRCPLTFKNLDAHEFQGNEAHAMRCRRMQKGKYSSIIFNKKKPQQSTTNKMSFK